MRVDGTEIKEVSAEPIRSVPYLPKESVTYPKICQRARKWQQRQTMATTPALLKGPAWIRTEERERPF